MHTVGVDTSANEKQGAIQQAFDTQMLHHMPLSCRVCLSLVCDKPILHSAKTMT